MSYIGFKYHPKIDVTVKKISADIKFTERPETIFAKLQRLKIKEEPPIDMK
jgi:hypothetical protein